MLSSIPSKRETVLDLSPDLFRALGHELVNTIADYLQELPHAKVTAGLTPSDVRKLIGADSDLPQVARDPALILKKTAELLIRNSLFNGHPRFLGYITSSPAPLGGLADMLASVLNPNCGAFVLSPVATEIEAQCIRWLGQLIGYGDRCGGVLVSGGNMANMVGIWAARKAMAGWNIREEGLTSKGLRYTVYATHQVHTWLHKTADLLGIGIQAIRWIDTSEEQVMDAGKLEQQIRKDRSQGCTPLAVVATAGSVGLGVVDPLQAIASVCKRQKIWFHVDGAYGALAAALPELRKCFAGLEEADSIAVDPHKWLYCPLEAGCTLVKNENSLLDAFCFHPEYYQFDKTGDETPINYYQFGPQNSRGFRALKVWMVLQQAGAEGIRTAIREDISYSRQLYEELGRYPNLEAFTENLSICTFRYVPDVLPTTGKEEYLNRLNMELVLRLQKGGELFVSNAVLNGNYLLRTCIVNFRTSLNDIRAIPDIVIRYGKEIEKELRKP